MGEVMTVRDAMLRHPVVHPADTTVGEARAALADRPKLRLMLLVQDGVLLGTLTREDLAAEADAASLAADLAQLDGRTVGVDAPLATTLETMVSEGRRRLAVVAGRDRLVGLLCLKQDRTGFCTDEGVNELRRSRTGTASSTS